MRRPRPARAAALLLAAALAPGCVQLSYRRTLQHREVPAEVSSDLAVREADLAECLDALGAPLFVWEQPEGWMALAYGWEDTRHGGVNLSVPISRFFSASVDYNEVDSELKGVVLVFDDERRLVRVRRGVLRELASSERPRPFFVEPDGDARRDR